MEKYRIFEPVMSIIVQYYINYAYQQYVTEKYDSLIDPQEKFEITERISRILAPLLKDFDSSTFVSITTNSPYGYYCVGPTDLQYIISESADINTTDCDGNAVVASVSILPFKHNMITSNKNNPFINPNNEEIWRVNFSGDKIELILSLGQAPKTYTCRYLKKLTNVNLLTGMTMEIDDSVHEEVVVRAAYMYLGDLDKNRDKLEQQQQQQKEKENV